MSTVLITGANRGIGLEFAFQYFADGWDVFAAVRNPAAAGELQRLASDSNGRVRILTMDVTDIGSVRHAAAKVGHTPIDVLINNAGVGGPQRQDLGHTDYETWAKVIDTNTFGPLRVIEQFIENVSHGERKLIVTLTSGMGSIGDNTSGGNIAYRSSKAAVNMTMRTLAIDLAPRGIACIVINPGWVQTQMGGPNARTSPNASVRAMRKVFDKIGLEHSGHFLNHDGREYPW